MDEPKTNKTILPPPHGPRAVVMTVDVEDYFMSPETIPFEAWDSFPSRIHTGMERCLRIFEECNVKATFFFVGWLAERYPEIVRWTWEQGHEIGTHTYNHTFVHHLTYEQYALSLRRSLEILRGICPEAKIIGHRAPAFSLHSQKPDQFAILKENGIRYDSSIIPHRTYLYGEPDAPRHPYWLYGVVEIPPAVIQFAGRRLPVGGGGTLRILPAWYLRWARGRYQAEGYPPVIYIHPWEFVPEQPDLDLSWKLKRIHNWGIHTVEPKLRSLFSGNETMTMAVYYEKICCFPFFSDSEPVRHPQFHLE